MLIRLIWAICITNCDRIIEFEGLALVLGLLPENPESLGLFPYVVVDFPFLKSGARGTVGFLPL